jgi:hypothetical protein
MKYIGFKHQRENKQIAIIQLYRGRQFYWWGKPEKTTITFFFPPLVTLLLI